MTDDNGMDIEDTPMGPEAKIEDAACKWAQEESWLAMKFTSRGRRSVPDRLFIKNGRVVFIEFKTEKGRLTPGQEREKRRLEAHGAEVYVCRTVNEVKLILEESYEDE